MPLPRPVARPSSLPLPRHVTELVPPPSVPTELTTPSPVRPKFPSFKARSSGPLANKTNEAVRKLSSKSTDQDTSDDGRGSSVSPTLQPKVARGVGRTKSVPKNPVRPSDAANNNKEHKFVRSLNQHIQTSNILYQDAGTDSSSSLKHQLHSVNRFSGNRFSTDSRVFFALV